MKLYKRTKLIHGIGINDADYNIARYGLVGDKNQIIWRCPYYIRWKNMLARCYSEKYREKRPTYIDCYVVDQWKYFSNFKAWMETQDWEGKDLDKDILFKNNKAYGPDTCVFVDDKTNKFLVDRAANRGEFPIGVCWHIPKGLYMAQCWSVKTGKQKNLGYFRTPEEAHQAWLAFKLKQAYILASEQTDERVAKALIERYENYQK